MNINKMIREISDIAVAEGLVNASWPARLQVKLRNVRGGSRGGNHNGPWISIATRGVWDYTPHQNAKEILAKLHEQRPGKLRDRRIRRLRHIEAGRAVWTEYASIAEDPEIGDLVGDPGDPTPAMAALLCHEMAHAIDYTAGAQTIDGTEYGAEGTSHSYKWRAIYRTLRNAYVASGDYKPAPTNNVTALPVAPTRAADDRTLTIGLPLFDIAA